MNYPTIYPTRKQHRRRKNEKKKISQQRSNLYRQRGNPVRRPLIKGFPVPWKNRVACKASERAQKFAYAAHRIDDIITVIDVTSAKVETPVFLEDRFTSFFSFHPSSVEPFFSLSFSLSLPFFVFSFLVRVFHGLARTAERCIAGGRARKDRVFRV